MTIIRDYITPIIAITLALFTFRKEFIAMTTTVAKDSKYLFYRALGDVLTPYCKHIRSTLNADRVLFWQIRNGMEMTIRGWKDMDLNAIAEDFAPNLPEYASQHQGIPMRNYNRNVDALISSDDGTLLVPDENVFDDELSRDNISNGWRAIAAAKCIDSKGVTVGFLVVGWDRPMKPEEMHIERIKQFANGYYPMVMGVLKQYTPLSRAILKKKFMIGKRRQGILVA